LFYINFNFEKKTNDAIASKSILDNKLNNHADSDTIILNNTSSDVRLKSKTRSKELTFNNLNEIKIDHLSCRPISVTNVGMDYLVNT